MDKVAGSRIDAGQHDALLCVSIAAAQQHLDPKLFDAAALATSRVDHACPNTPKGRDPCACQLACTDLQCANAGMRPEFNWCSDMDTNAAKRIEKKVATLKVKGPAGPFLDAFGPLSVLSGRPFSRYRRAEVRPASYGRARHSPHFVQHPTAARSSTSSIAITSSTRRRTNSYVNGLGEWNCRPAPDYLADPIAVHLSKFVPEAHIILLWRDPINARTPPGTRTGARERRAGRFNDAVSMNCPSSGDAWNSRPPSRNLLMVKTLVVRAFISGMWNDAPTSRRQPGRGVNEIYQETGVQAVPLQRVVWGPRGHVRFTLFTCRRRPAGPCSRRRRGLGGALPRRRRSEPAEEAGVRHAAERVQ